MMEDTSKQNEIFEQLSEFSLEDIIANLLSIPGVRVDRTEFLTKMFNDDDVDVEEVVDKGPVDAGITRERIEELADKLIAMRTTQSSIASFTLGIPGGVAMVASVPSDVTQFFGMALRLAQELSYLYGAESLWDDGEVDEDKVKTEFILYCGVMFGVAGAAHGIRVLTAQIAKTTEKRLVQKALTTTVWYPILKQICKAVGVNMTKNIAAKGVSKIIPVVGGVISGALNFASMMPMAKRLHEELDKAAFDYSIEEYEADLIFVEEFECE